MLRLNSLPTHTYTHTNPHTPGRRSRVLPDHLGRGNVVILGEAAHPVPPTGLEASMALEDAAELAAAVQQYGLVSC